MVKTKAHQAPAAHDKISPKTRGSSTVLFVAALDMSWRLALAVLVPIIGGFELDKHFGISPVLTIVGFLAAMAGVFLVLRQTVAGMDDKFKPTQTPR